MPKKTTKMTGAPTTKPLDVHLVMAVHSLRDHPVNLVSRLSRESKHALTWHIFQHSTLIPETIAELKRMTGTMVYEHGQNRGIARSWNEGVLNAHRKGAQVVVVLNDDIYAGGDDLDALAAAAMENPDAGIIQCEMYHNGPKPTTSGFGFTVIQHRAVAITGMFDQNFFPAYYEDVDYAHRLSRSGLRTHLVTGTNVRHAGSANLKENAALKAQTHAVTFPRNRAYYIRKWGGDIDAEKYRQPFSDVRFGLRIAPCDRDMPYPGYDRTDQDIVAI